MRYPWLMEAQACRRLFEAVLSLSLDPRAASEATEEKSNGLGNRQASQVSSPAAILLL